MTTKRAEFRFYAKLNDFLPQQHRFATLVRLFDGEVSVKDMIEATGVPHTEVDLVIVNGESVDFTYRVRDGDRIAVYPMFEALDIGPIARVRAEPLREPRFAADTHLGRLARHLRLLGFDTAYDSHWDDAHLAATAAAENRILLTRDVGLLKRNIVTHGLFVRAQQPRAQLLEVVRRLQLVSRFRPFARCLACNGVLAEVSKGEVAAQIPERVWRSHDQFVRCTRCARVYGQERIMIGFVASLRRFKKRLAPRGETLFVDDENRAVRSRSCASRRGDGWLARDANLVT